MPIYLIELDNRYVTDLDEETGVEYKRAMWRKSIEATISRDDLFDVTMIIFTMQYVNVNNANLLKYHVIAS